MSSELYMIPCPISENDHADLSDYVIKQIHTMDHFIVERAKTARKFIKTLNHPIPLQDLIIEEMDKHDKKYALEIYKQWIQKGIKVGIISEAGCPGIADPGARYVDLAHQKGVRVIPLIGPSSILLALMASGMNGQSFSFHGYLPNRSDLLQRKLKDLERNAIKNRFAEIFMETPYRNKAMFREILSTCSNQIKLCIAADITGRDEYIKTKTIQEWKNTPFPLPDKIPAIYILGT